MKEDLPYLGKVQGRSFTLVTIQKYELITGDGRYGNLGPFECPSCSEKYYATIDDHQEPSLYVAIYGEQPSSLLDSEGKKRSIEIKNNGLGYY